MAGPVFHGVLLAGGSGTRFWPLSRAARPKQLLPLAGGRSLLAQSWARLRRLVPPSRLWVVAPRNLVGQVRAELPRLRDDRLVVEPSPRDTGPAVGLACATVARVDPTAVVGIFPTDHAIRDERAFETTVRRAIREARREALVCLGVRPDRPATGFGYLRCARRPRPGEAMDVERFVEKPNAARARHFVRSGRYLWNGGMFVWGARRLLEEMARTAPTMLRAVEATAAGSARAWSRAPRLSVDYAVMERARGVRVVALEAGWDDVGSWDAAARLREEAGVASSQHVFLDSAGTVAFGERRMIAVVDVPGIVIVDTEDALLVVRRERAEDVRRVVELLRVNRRKELL